MSARYPGAAVRDPIDPEENAASLPGQVHVISGPELPGWTACTVSRIAPFQELFRISNASKPYTDAELKRFGRRLRDECYDRVEFERCFALAGHAPRAIRLTPNIQSKTHCLFVFPPRTGPGKKAVPYFYHTSAHPMSSEDLDHMFQLGQDILEEMASIRTRPEEGGPKKEG